METLTTTPAHQVRVRRTTSLQGGTVSIATCSACEWIAVDTSGLTRDLDPFIDHHEATA